jgi:hypothetical protein
MKKCYLVLAVLTIMLLAISCGPTTPPPKTLDYQVLREWDIPAGGIGMELLVSETATKEEVLALANYLRSEHPKGYLYISIYDSKQAQVDALKGTLSDEDFHKHFLVDISRNPKTGYDEITWVATERGY